jgi:hypothetical protein
MIPRRPRKNKEKGRSRSNQQGKSMPILVAFTHPPMIQPQLRHFQRMRFIVKANVNVNTITYQNLLDSFLVATAAAVGYQIFDQVKVKFVEIWATPIQGSGASSPAITSCAVAYPGPDGDGKVISDTAMGSEPAHVMAVPSKLSQTAFWQSTGATAAFQITCPMGGVVDVGLSFRNTDLAPTAVGSPLVGATVGQFYYRGLDGAATAATNYQPVAPLVQ